MHLTLALLFKLGDEQGWDITCQWVLLISELDSSYQGGQDFPNKRGISIGAGVSGGQFKPSNHHLQYRDKNSVQILQCCCRSYWHNIQEVHWVPKRVLYKHKLFLYKTLLTECLLVLEGSLANKQFCFGKIRKGENGCSAQKGWQTHKNNNNRNIMQL